jgi:cellulose synthase/poly-beta-1,6-N-acetylglucosamine synthase-like glycosyltransferase
LTVFACILAVLLLAQGIVSLAGGVKFIGFVRKSLLVAPSGPMMAASIIAPIKGLEPGLEDNINSLFRQNYPVYEVVFVIADEHDAARAVIEAAIAENGGCHARLIIAEPGTGRGEKVNNLLRGVAGTDPASEVLVFVDSDARVSPEWLGALVSALSDGAVGASTGYRWYLPARGGFWTALVSAWNGSIATTLGDHGRNFVWGGSAAIRRDTFDRINVAQHWDKALSDDYALTRAVQQAGLHIVFVPRCLLITREDFGLRSALEFTRRQITITRVYKPAAWWAGLISHSLSVLGFFGGLAWGMYAAIGVAIRSGGSLATNASAAMAEGWLGGPRWSIFVIASLLVIYVLGCIKGWIRLKAASLMIPSECSELRRTGIMFGLLWPLVSLLFLYDFLASTATRRIRWRGIWYEMRSPTETVVLDSKK